MSECISRIYALFFKTHKTLVTPDLDICSGTLFKTSMAPLFAEYTSLRREDMANDPHSYARLLRSETCDDDVSENGVERRDEVVERTDEDVERRDEDVESMAEDVERRDEYVERRDEDVERRDEEVERSDEEVACEDKDTSDPQSADYEFCQF